MSPAPKFMSQKVNEVGLKRIKNKILNNSSHHRTRKGYEMALLFCREDLRHGPFLGAVKGKFRESPDPEPNRVLCLNVVCGLTNIRPQCFLFIYPPQHICEITGY